MRDERADAVGLAEGNIPVVIKGETMEPLRGRRPWHATHSYNMVTRETLPVLDS